MDLVLVGLERLCTPWARQAPAKSRTPQTVAVEAYRVGA
jgi:hypothetical protein